MKKIPRLWKYPFYNSIRRLEIQVTDESCTKISFNPPERLRNSLEIEYDIKNLVNIEFDSIWEKIKTKYFGYYKNLNFPPIIWEGTSHNCQLKCPTCRPEVIFDKQPYQKELWEYITPILNDSRVKSVMIGPGGDPFVDKERINYLRNLTTEVLEQKFSIQICTNGLALTEKMWNSFGDLKKHRDKLDITISLDAATKDTYNINRVLGNWDKINENLKFLSTLNLGQLNIDMTVQKNNYKEMVDFVKLGNSLNINTSLRAMNNWYWEDARYIDNAVHLKKHPLNNDFKKELNKANKLGAIGLDLTKFSVFK